MKIAQLGVVTCAVLALTGCFELDTRVTIAADGSGTVDVTTMVQESFLAAMDETGKGRAEIEQKASEKMPTALSDARKAELAAAGVDVLDLAVNKTDAGIGWHGALHFATPASLAAVGPQSDLSATPELWIVDLGGGAYEAHLKERTSPDDVEPDMGGAADDGKKKSKKQLKKDMAAIGKMMESIGDLRISYRLTVPGTITSVEPVEGTFTGGEATWATTGQQLMAAMQAQVGTPGEKHMIAYFTMPEGQTLPAEALSAPR